MKYDEGVGYASKYYFAKRGSLKDYEEEPWYFGEMSREEAEHLLRHRANSDGSFLVRYSSNKKTDVLSLKCQSKPTSQPTKSNQRSKLGYKYHHHLIKMESASVWLTNDTDDPSELDKYKNLSEMIKALTDDPSTLDKYKRLREMIQREKRIGISIKLTSVCVIPSPHTDPEFESYVEDYNSLCVPQHQIETGEVISSESSGFVRTARLRGSIDVVVQRLKFQSQEESSEAFTAFFEEIGDLQRLDHPNITQLFGFTLNAKKESFLILGTMIKGDLKIRLQEMWRRGESCGDATLLWAVEVASGMERLASLKIVHGDLAAR